MENIQKQVLEERKLNDADLLIIKSKVQNFLKLLENHLSEKKIKAKPVIGGSFAKGTILKDDFDCDIFVKFNLSYKEYDLSNILETALLGFDNLHRIHGSRDYFQIRHDEIEYELIPVLDIKYPREAQNVTDMSPMHVIWAKKNIDKNPKLKDEIIIAKSFCKAQNLYGAESYISGFSGHVLDILIAYYGSFQRLLENSITWQKYKVIDVEGYNTIDDLNKSKISPLIVIDPVDKNRNAAAALSLEKFDRFKKKSAQYLNKPSPGFFIKKIIDNKSLKIKAENNKLIIIDIKPIAGKIDVVGSKILKIYEYIKTHLFILDFKIINSGWDWDKKNNALIWFIMDPNELSPEKIHTGPPINDKPARDAFEKKHENCFIRNNRLYTMVKRLYTKPENLVAELIKDEYIKERAEKISMKLYFKK